MLTIALSLRNTVNVKNAFQHFTAYSISFTFYFMNSLFISQICYEFTIHFGNSLSFSREFTIYHANSLSIYCLYRECCTNSREYTLNPLDVPRIYYEFTYFIADSSRNYLVFRKLTMNSLSISRFHCQFTRYLAILI